MINSVGRLTRFDFPAHVQNENHLIHSTGISSFNFKNLLRELCTLWRMLLRTTLLNVLGIVDITKDMEFLYSAGRKEHTLPVQWLPHLLSLRIIVIRHKRA